MNIVLAGSFHFCKKSLWVIWFLHHHQPSLNQTTSTILSSTNLLLAHWFVDEYCILVHQSWTLNECLTKIKASKHICSCTFLWLPFITTVYSFFSHLIGLKKFKCIQLSVRRSLNEWKWFQKVQFTLTKTELTIKGNCHSIRFYSDRTLAETLPGD